MTSDRLSLALGAGVLPAEGRILALGPGSGVDLSALPRDRVVVVQGFRPDHDAWVARGYAAIAEPAEAEGEFAAAVVFLARARDASRARMAEAAAHLPVGAPVWVDGAKTEGVDSLLKDLRGRADVSPALAKAHGKIALMTNPGAAAFADWQARDLAPVAGFVTRPGVFSAHGVDRGSQLLAAALPGDLKGRVADLGAGWGWLAAQVLTRPGVRVLHVVEADRAALDCARRNVSDPRAQFHWADATRFAPGERLDVVVMNPPFHVARAADPGLGVAFVRAAARLLAPSGRLYMVANRHLPYEAALTQTFRQSTEIAGDPGFKVLMASGPLPPARR